MPRSIPSLTDRAASMLVCLPALVLRYYVTKQEAQRLLEPFQLTTAAMVSDVH